MSSSSSIDVGNPIIVIQTKLQNLRSEREQTQNDIETLEMEKKAIKAILPRVVHELRLSRESVNGKLKDMNIYDTAISEIESKYSHIIYSIQDDDHDHQ